MTLAPIPEESDRVAGRPIMWVLIATVITIALCVGVVWAANTFALAGGGESGVNAEAGIDRIPPSTPFSFSTTPEEVRAAQKAEIDRWIDAEIDRYLQEAR